MKKLFLIAAVLVVWTILMITCFSGCKSDKDKDESPSLRVIKGIAAIGAFIEEGSTVQVRPAQVDGVPSEIIEGVVGPDGTYEVVIPEEVPVEPEVTDEFMKSYILKSGSTPENGTGFIIRVWSPAMSTWIYSYSENDGPETIANVNPYTDMMVRRFYATANNSAYPLNNAYDQDINNIFTSGLFHDGVTPVNVPTNETITIAMNLMSKMLYRIYGLSDIQNALIDDWEIDLGLDGLLNASGRSRMNELLQYEFEYIYVTPDLITDGYAIQPEMFDAVDVEIWSSHGDTGTVTMMLRGVTYTMNKEADSVNGANHFKCQSNTGLQLNTGEGVGIYFSDCSGTLYIKRS